MAGRLSQRAISFVTAIIIVRILGPADYGKYTFVISIIAIAQVIWDFGLGTLITRDIAQDASLADAYSGGTIILRSISAILILTILVIVLIISHYDGVIIQSVIIYGIGIFLSSITAMFMSVFSAYRRMEYSAYLSVIRPAALLMLILYVMKAGYGITWIFFSYFIAIMLTFLIAIIFIKKFIHPIFVLQASFLFDLMRKGFPFLLISVVSIILFRIDQLMLSKMVTNQELGYYGSAYTLFEVIISFFPMLVMSSSFPVLSSLYSKDKTAMTDLVNIILKIFLLLGIPISCGAVLLGSKITVVLYGIEYKEAGILLSILGSGIWIFFISLLLSWTLTASNKQDLVLKVTVIAMFINIIVNVFAIKTFGAAGAAITTVMCELFMMLVFIFVQIKIIKPEIILEILKTGVCSVIMVFFIMVTKNNLFIVDNFFNLIMLIVLSAVIYIGFAFLLKAVDIKEVKTIAKY